jgi:hypothetical protein
MSDQLANDATAELIRLYKEGRKPKEIMIALNEVYGRGTYTYAAIVGKTHRLKQDGRIRP